MQQQHKYSNQLKYFALAIFIFQIAVLILYGLFVRVDTIQIQSYLQNTYPWYQDINVMMLIGFGYLLAAIKNYGWSALGFTFFINAMAVQQYLLLQGFWQRVFHGNFANSTISLNTINLMQSSFASAAVLISFGAVLGRVGPLELFIMTLIQIFGYSLNEEIIYSGGINVIDYGGSMSIHIFGAYFGLAFSYILGKKIKLGAKKPEPDYISCIYGMIGTLFLWLFWPSFNAGSIQIENNFQRMIGITNTILCLTGSCISAFAFSIILRGGKFSMDDILNATIAGGVAMGSSCSIITNPAASIAIGVVAGWISTYGFARLSQKLAQKISLYDTVGVHNLHAIPGVMGGLASAVIISNYNLTPLNIGKATVSFQNDNFNYQGGIQVAGTFISLGMGIFFGMLAGFIIRGFYEIKNTDFFEDEVSWELPQPHQQINGHQIYKKEAVGDGSPVKDV